MTRGSRPILRPEASHVPSLAGRRTQGRRGFTLVEIMAVLVLAAILSTLTVVSLLGRAKPAEMKQVIAGLEHVDRMTREYCRRFDRTAELHFDLDDGVVRESDGPADVDATGKANLNGSGNTGNGRMQWALPAGFQMESVWVGGRKTYSGEVAIPVTRNGSTPSYLVILRGSERQSDAGELKRYLLWAGLTGQCVEVENEQEAAQTLALLENKASPSNPANPVLGPVLGDDAH